MRRSQKLVTAAHERLIGAILDIKLKFATDTALKRHFLNVHRHENAFGISFRKAGGRESSRKVDIYAALMLAHEAYHDFRTRSKTAKREHTGEVYFL
jgi:hypothetical protein